MKLTPKQIVDCIVPLVEQAGMGIMKIYQQEDYRISVKDDLSPLTEADLLANTILVHGLKKLLPSIPVLSEEGGDLLSEGVAPTCYWAVDPLDGTKEFIRRNGEFTVNVALIFRGEPILGVVLAPALDRLYVGYTNINIFDGDFTPRVESEYPNKNAMKREGGKWINIAVSDSMARGSHELMRIASSRSHPSPEMVNWLEQFEKHEAVEVGSSLKFCMVAEGAIDVYPRFGPTCIWDTAAGHAVVIAAGGKVINRAGASLTYGYWNILNEYFIAHGRCKFTP